MSLQIPSQTALNYPKAYQIFPGQCAKKQLQLLLNRDLKANKITKSMRNAETRNRIWFKMLYELADNLDLDMECFFLGISLFDGLISDFKVPVAVYLELAIVVLDFAFKIRKPRSQIFNLLSLGSRIANCHPQLLKEIQKVALHRLDFKIETVTVFDFVIVMLEIDGKLVEKDKKEMTQLEKFDRDMFVGDILLLSHYDLDILQNHNRDLSLAGAIVYLSRQRMDRKPFWPLCLRDMTGLESESLLPLVIQLEFRHNYGNIETQN